MRLRNITGSAELIAKSRYVCTEPRLYKGKWNRYFQNVNPIYIEIGMGKGQFISTMAGLYPEVNFVGIERYSSLLYRAVQKMERAPATHLKPQLQNLALLCMDARDLTAVFAPGEVAKIYLNFSDPWPKDRHARRRLTARDFLAIYAEILADDGQIEFKTDNKDLFDFSLAEQESAGWRLKAVSSDWHKDPEARQGNVMTEYEEKFSARGNPIFKYVISR